MGNENSQITFPIKSNTYNNKMKINNKKIKNKDILNKPIDQKIKIPKNPKILKGYVIPRISATPDRNINIPGINKESINNKRYISYEKDLKTNSNTNQYKNKENEFKNSINNRNINNKSIIYITNLLNSIYSYGIDKELSHINLLNTGTKNLNFNNSSNKKYVKKDRINVMFDVAFKYNYFYNNSNRIRKRNNSKNRYNSPRICDSKFHSSDSKNAKNSNKESVNHNIKNIKLNENMKKNIDNHNNTLVLNALNIDNEIISVNNKKKNSNNYLNQNKKNNKKYSESQFISESESGFVSSEEMSLINNMQKMEKKAKEEDASESQTDKQEKINQNLLNKNKINNNYFIDSELNQKINNHMIFKNNELSIVSNINNLQINSNHFNSHINNETNQINDQNYIKQKSNNKKEHFNTNNIVICSYDNANNKQRISDADNDDEIILINNESNKYDDNNTYMEILLAMNEKNPENNKISNFYNMPNKTKKMQKDLNQRKNNENEKQILPQNISSKREITPKMNGTKREITPKSTSKIIQKSKKTTPLKKIPISGNINNTNNNINNKNNINNGIIINNDIHNNININNILSAKKSERKSMNRSNKNSANKRGNNLSPKKLIRKSMNKSNNNSPIINSTGNSYINNIKHKKNAETPSPSNSPIPSPLNHFNNNYKDRYAYKKKTQIINLKNSKKLTENNTNNISHRNSLNNNHLTHPNNVNKNYNTNKMNNTNNYVYINNSKKLIRNSGNKNKIIYFKKERLSGNSFNKIQNNNETLEVEQRTKSNDQKYSVYNSKTVLSSKKKQK